MIDTERAATACWDVRKLNVTNPRLPWWMWVWICFDFPVTLISAARPISLRHCLLGFSNKWPSYILFSKDFLPIWKNNWGKIHAKICLETIRIYTGRWELTYGDNILSVLSLGQVHRVLAPDGLLFLVTLGSKGNRLPLFVSSSPPSSSPSSLPYPNPPRIEPLHSSPFIASGGSPFGATQVREKYQQWEVLEIRQILQSVGTVECGNDHGAHVRKKKYYSEDAASASWLETL